MRQNINDSLYMPPPEDLIKKSVIENEQFKTGAPIPFIKLSRFVGLEKIEKLNPNNQKDAFDTTPTPSDIAHANTITDYLINAKMANRLVYCRFGEKYVTDLEKRKNSNISSLN